MTKEDARRVAVKLLIHIFDDPSCPDLSSQVRREESEGAWGAIYLRLEGVKELIEEIQKGMKGEII